CGYEWMHTLDISSRSLKFILQLCNALMFLIPSVLRMSALKIKISFVPQFRRNAEIQRTVKRYWQNVPGAIPYLKEAI
ncbi:MAG: hypothetical protein RMY35_029210, partial [Nostoc sp. DedSLP01]